MSQEPLLRVKCFLLDMDGTFNLGNGLIDGSLYFIDTLKELGKDYLFLTNNSSKHRGIYAEKITRLGLPITEEKVFTSGEATAIYLQQEHPSASVYVVGTPALEEEFRQHGFRLEEHDPQLIVLGFDTTLTYQKLWKLCDFVRAGLPYIATHPDFNCPTETGYMPDIGAMIAFVKAATGREPDLVVGKPNRMIVDAVARKYGFPIEEMAMVGDRLYTDIALGQTSGITTCLVWSGETHPQDLAGSPFQPTYMFDNLGAIADWLREHFKKVEPEKVNHMTKLSYDPADGKRFWEAIRKLPGFPANESMPIKEMIFEADALFRTTEILESVGARRDAPLVVVMDETPMRRAGQNLKELILGTLRRDGWSAQVTWMRADESGQVHTDMPHIREVQAALSHGCSVLSVGSGVVTDIAKHGCFLYGQETGESVPFVVYQTANSVSAYTSNMSPTFVDGVKRTLDSRYPDALICDLETLRDAPAEMTAGGVGDMLAVFVSFPDWYLAHRLGMDSTYSELAKNLVGPLDQILLAHADGIRRGEMESVAMLAKIISLGGLAMSLSHATTPMSGFEHVMSHVLDLQAEIAHSPLTIHGSQVALAALAGAEMYQEFLSEFDPIAVNLDTCYPSMALMKARIEENFGKIDPSGKAGAECWADYRQKLEKWHAHRKDFESTLQDWEAVCARLAEETRSPQMILQILQATGAPVRWSQLQPAVHEEQAHFAFLNAPLMRKRLTLGDLLVFTDWDRERLWKDIWNLYA